MQAGRRSGKDTNNHSIGVVLLRQLSAVVRVSQLTNAHVSLTSYRPTCLQVHRLLHKDSIVQARVPSSGPGGG